MMMDWQPIETAPRDTDEYVLLAWKYGLGISMARWVPGDDCWLTQDAVEMPGDSRFTHWMPLPEPPTEHTPMSEAATQTVELLEAASDYARMVQVERLDREDIAVVRGYERLRNAIANFGR